MFKAKAVEAAPLPDGNGKLVVRGDQLETVGRLFFMLFSRSGDIVSSGLFGHQQTPRKKSGINTENCGLKSL